MTNRVHPSTRAWRSALVIVVFFMMAVVLVARAAYLQVIHQDFYVDQGKARQVREVQIPANRGDLFDRNGDPLAISTPVPSLWGVPRELVSQPDVINQVAETLNIDADNLLTRIQNAHQKEREFVYIKRHAPPDLVEQVLTFPKIRVQREYRRYYPSGSAASHIIGFTNIDDSGSEGLELAYDGWLSGEPGTRAFVQDVNGREIVGLGTIKPAVPGKDLTLSIDRQLQYFASRALQSTVKENQAESGSVVVLDTKTGEVLAMANFPTYNPNDISDRSGGKQRNRAVTDVFEPGSTMKPFTIAAALASKEFVPTDIVYTSPGRYTIGRYEITDDGKDHGWLDLNNIVIKSSNVGISKIARQLNEEHMWSVFDSFGFGRPPGSEFPGESSGFFNHSSNWNYTEQASVSYGYGISVSALQLARGYAAIANDGVMPDVSFTAIEQAAGERRVLEEEYVEDLTNMLEGVVAKGTGKRARIPGYRVAGKTGTSHISLSGGYSEDRYVSVFAGFAPVSDPRLAISVVIQDPKAGQHFGGVVAAPVFADVMSHGLRLMGVEPDDTGSSSTKTSSLAVKNEGENS